MSQEGLQDPPETPPPDLASSLVRPLPNSTAPTAHVFGTHDCLASHRAPPTCYSPRDTSLVSGARNRPLPRASCPSQSSEASTRRPCTRRLTRRPPGPGSTAGCGPSPGCARPRRQPALKGKGRTEGGRRDSRGRLSWETLGRSVSVGLFLRGSAGCRPPDVGAVFCRCPPLTVLLWTSVQFSNCRPELREPTVPRGRVGRLGDSYSFQARVFREDRPC